MTYLQLQDEVMDRLNLSSTEARTRIKVFLNDAYRKLATSVSMMRVRWSTVSFPTVAGTFTYSPTTLLKPITIVYPAGNRVLDQRSMDELRMIDPDSSTTGAPQSWALQKFNAATCIIYIWPKPDAVYTLNADGIVRGAELQVDGDIPAIPEDFHDILSLEATADELMKMEKPALAKEFDAKAEARARELRYFMAKSSYLHLQQGSMSEWWWGPWFYNYRGFFGG